MEKETQNIIEMRNIVKDFNGFKANNGINLTLRKGEILALLGENGAGKSTLMSILSGLLEPTSGEILVNGKKVKITDPNVAEKLGIGMVHQHFVLAQSFTVLENLVLAHKVTKGAGILDFKAARKEITALSKRYGLTVDLDAKISTITVAQQQRVEILKVLYRGADILIFDEPTAVLTPQEITEFIKIIKNLAAEGRSIILITHKLAEIELAADRVTVIRAGKSIDTIPVSEASDEQLADMMVGRHVNLTLNKKKAQIGQPILQVQNLQVKANQGHLAIKGLSLEAHAGEILGIAGIDGNGQDELVEAITGLRHVESGKILIKDEDMTNKRVRQITELGVAHIPADRQRYGLILPMSLDENLALQTYYQKPYSNRGIINYPKIREHGNNLIKKYDVRTTSGDLLVRELSGGNQQKAIIARELERNADLIIAFQPTRGLDVGAIEYIHRQLLQQRDAGKAILLVSYELEEIMQLSDRIVVLHNGQASGEVKPENTDEKALGLLMTGVQSKKAGAPLD